MAVEWAPEEFAVTTEAAPAFHRAIALSRLQRRRCEATARSRPLELRNNDADRLGTERQPILDPALDQRVLGASQPIVGLLFNHPRIPDAPPAQEMDDLSSADDR